MGPERCPICICHSLCPPITCEPGCAVDYTGLKDKCPSCICDERTCPSVSCGGLCETATGPDGCPQCQCHAVCRAITCGPGCEVDYSGTKDKCPICRCRGTSTSYSISGSNQVKPRKRTSSIVVATSIVVTTSSPPEKSQGTSEPDEEESYSAPNCPPVECGGLCKLVDGPDGCEICVCDSQCPRVKCHKGCRIDYSGTKDVCPRCECSVKKRKKTKNRKGRFTKTTKRSGGLKIQTPLSSGKLSNKTNQLDYKGKPLVVKSPNAEMRTSLSPDKTVSVATSTDSESTTTSSTETSEETGTEVSTSTKSSKTSEKRIVEITSKLPTDNISTTETITTSDVRTDKTVSESSDMGSSDADELKSPTKSSSIVTTTKSTKTTKPSTLNKSTRVSSKRHRRRTKSKIINVLIEYLESFEKKHTTRKRKGGDKTIIEATSKKPRKSHKHKRHNRKQTAVSSEDSLSKYKEDGKNSRSGNKIQNTNRRLRKRGRNKSKPTIRATTETTTTFYSTEEEDESSSSNETDETETANSISTSTKRGRKMKKHLSTNRIEQKSVDTGLGGQPNDGDAKSTKQSRTTRKKKSIADIPISDLRLEDMLLDNSWETDVTSELSTFDETQTDDESSPSATETDESVEEPTVKPNKKFKRSHAKLEKKLKVKKRSLLEENHQLSEQRIIGNKKHNRSQVTVSADLQNDILTESKKIKVKNTTDFISDVVLNKTTPQIPDNTSQYENPVGDNAKPLDSMKEKNDLKVHVRKTFSSKTSMPLKKASKKGNKTTYVSTVTTASSRNISKATQSMGTRLPNRHDKRSKKKQKHGNVNQKLSRRPSISSKIVSHMKTHLQTKTSQKTWAVQKNHVAAKQSDKTRNRTRNHLRSKSNSITPPGAHSRVSPILISSTGHKKPKPFITEKNKLMNVKFTEQNNTLTISSNESNIISKEQRKESNIITNEQRKEVNESNRIKFLKIPPNLLEMISKRIKLLEYFKEKVKRMQSWIQPTANTNSLENSKIIDTRNIRPETSGVFHLQEDTPKEIKREKSVRHPRGIAENSLPHEPKGISSLEASETKRYEEESETISTGPQLIDDLAQIIEYISIDERSQNNQKDKNQKKNTVFYEIAKRQNFTKQIMSINEKILATTDENSSVENEKDQVITLAKRNQPILIFPNNDDDSDYHRKNTALEPVDIKILENEKQMKLKRFKEKNIGNTVKAFHGHNVLKKSHKSSNKSEDKIEKLSHFNKKKGLRLKGEKIEHKSYRLNHLSHDKFVNPSKIEIPALFDEDTTHETSIEETEGMSNTTDTIDYGVSATEELLDFFKDGPRLACDSGEDCSEEKGKQEFSVSESTSDTSASSQRREPKMSSESTLEVTDEIEKQEFLTATSSSKGSKEITETSSLSTLETTDEIKEASSTSMGESEEKDKKPEREENPENYENKDNPSNAQHSHSDVNLVEENESMAPIEKLTKSPITPEEEASSLRTKRTYTFLEPDFSSDVEENFNSRIEEYNNQIIRMNSGNSKKGKRYLFHREDGSLKIPVRNSQNTPSLERIPADGHAVSASGEPPSRIKENYYLREEATIRPPLLDDKLYENDQINFDYEKNAEMELLQSLNNKPLQNTDRTMAETETSVTNTEFSSAMDENETDNKHPEFDITETDDDLNAQQTI